MRVCVSPLGSPRPLPEAVASAQPRGAVAVGGTGPGLDALEKMAMTAPKMISTPLVGEHAGRAGTGFRPGLVGHGPRYVRCARCADPGPVCGRQGSDQPARARGLDALRGGHALERHAVHGPAAVDDPCRGGGLGERTQPDRGGGLAPAACDRTQAPGEQDGQSRRAWTPRCFLAPPSPGTGRHRPTSTAHP